MISSNKLKSKGMETMDVFYNKTLDFYNAGKTAQCRSYLKALSREQKKEYLIKVSQLYPEDTTQLQFVLQMI